MTYFNFRRRASLVVRWLSVTLVINIVITTTFIRYHQSRDKNRSTALAKYSDKHAPFNDGIDRRSGRYVTLCPQRFHGDHRTGNHLFLLAAAIYVAERTNRTVAMPSCGWPLDRTFDLRPAAGSPAKTSTFHGKTGSDQRIAIVRYDDGEPPCPCRTITPPHERPYNIDERNIDSTSGLAELRRSRHKSLALCGLYQTFRYADALGSRLRKLLTFRPEILSAAAEFRRRSLPVGWTEGSFVRVGVHVRRGDFMRSVWRSGVGESTGDILSVADEVYFHRAVDNFIAKHRKLQFVVATDDWHWTHEVFRAKFAASRWLPVPVARLDGDSSRNAVSVYVSNWTASSSSSEDGFGKRPEVAEVSIAFADDERRGASTAAAVDLAVLSDCDAVVMSTGSFSWWGAWLANKTAVYYDRWPRPVPRTRGGIAVEFDNSLYFPPRWMALH